MTASETYLGDGLYASFDGQQIRLWTPRPGGIHEVFLDDETLPALERWIADIRNTRAAVLAMGEPTATPEVKIGRVTLIPQSAGAHVIVTARGDGAPGSRPLLGHLTMTHPEWASISRYVENADAWMPREIKEG